MVVNITFMVKVELLSVHHESDFLMVIPGVPLK